MKRTAIAVMVLLFVLPAQAEWRYHCVTESWGHRTKVIWHMENAKIEGLTLREAIKVLRAGTIEKDVPFPDSGENFIVKWDTLTEEQKSAKIWMDATGYSIRDTLQALCKKMALGYRIDEYAIVIASRAKLPLPETKSTTLGPLLESTRTEPKFVIRFVDEHD